MAEALSELGSVVEQDCVAAETLVDKLRVENGRIAGH